MTELQADLFAGSNEIECEEAYADLLVIVASQLAASEAAGRLRLDEQEEANCRAQAAAGTCEQFRDLQCSFGFLPQVQVGGACTQDIECVGAVCIGEAFGESPTEGTCDAPHEVGEFCAEDDDCAGAYCDRLLSECADRVPPAAPCTGDSQCTTNVCTEGVCAAQSSTCTL